MNYGQNLSHNCVNVFPTGRNAQMLETNSLSFCTYAKPTNDSFFDFSDEIEIFYISYHYFSCNLREGAATYRLVSEYVKLAVSEKPEIVQDLIQQIQERCSVQNELAEENNSVEEVNAIERIRCIIEATNDAVKETDFQKIWEEYKKDLEQLLERLKDCKNEASPWEQAK